MNSIFSLRLKLIIYTLLFIIFAVFSVGYISNNNIEEHYNIDVQSQFKESLRVVSTELKNTEKHIFNMADLISKDKNIIASMSLIRNYENINDYNSLLFDEEKKRIVNILTLKGKYSLSDSTAIYDSYGKLVAFVKKVKSRYLASYVSYENSKKVFYSKEIDELVYNKSDLGRGLDEKLKNSNDSLLFNLRDEGVAYEMDKETLKLEVKQAIFKNLPNGNKVLLGYTKSAKYFRAQEISASLNSHVFISYSKYNKEESKYLSPILFSQFNSNELHIYDKNNLFLTSVHIPLKKGSLLLNISTNKKKFEETLANNKQDLILLMVMIVLITISISLLILDKMISSPLKKLLIGINTLSMGDYKHKINIKSNDELGLISTQFNNMAEEISHRETLLHELAHYDSLTKIPNRAMFIENLEKAIKRAKRLDTKLAVFFLDLDEFKNINDTLGHQIGDKLLVEISKNLSKALREQDILSRIGGDEFNILIEDLSSIKDLGNIAEKCLQQIKDQLNIDGNVINVTGSIGISVYPNDGENSSDLLKNADLAMYKAKNSGKNQYSFFSAELEKTLTKRLNMLQELKHALKKDELKLYYQPKFSLLDGSIYAAEALLRWDSSKLGSITPDQFIPLAEESGEIVEIGAWVVQQACIDFAAWSELGLGIKQVSINVSNVQFERDDIVKVLSDNIQSSGIPAESLEVEITESFMQEDSAKALQTLKDIRTLGVELAIDDFGTGYSSMSYLKRLPINRLKIDRSFISDIPHDNDDVEITKIIVSLAKIMNLSITAEGIETLEQIRFLEELGADEGQGYICSKALPYEQFVALIHKRPNCTN